MRRLKTAFLILLLSPSLVLGKEAVIANFGGTVEYRSGAQAEWKAASKGVEIPESGAIRTGADGRAILIFSNGSRVWLKPGTTLALEKKNARATVLSLIAGEIKSRVPHLRFREKFNITTRTSIVAVRGTILTMSANEYGDSSVSVLYGEAHYSHVKPDTQEPTQTVRVTQGNGYIHGAYHLLNKEQELLGLEDWSPGLSDQERRSSLEETARRREEIRQFAQQMKSMEDEVAASRASIKEEDFAAGRTLTDVHGNLVRVDQRLDRPDARTIQVINVVKRKGYASGGFRRFSYNGPSVSRFDSLLAKVEFNKNLPDGINEFPGFFDTEGKNLKIESSQLVMANTTDSDNVFTVAFVGKRDPDSGKDEIDPDLYIGTLKSGGGTGARKKLFNLTLKSDKSIDGLTHFAEEKPILNVVQEGRNGQLYRNEAQRFTEVGNAGNKIWLASEQFIINNEGNIRNVSDFTGGATNFEALLKNTAGEVAVFVKNDLAGDPDLVNDVTADRSSGLSGIAGGNTLKNNIDLVVVPDLAVSIVKTIATSGDVFSNAK